MPITKQDFEKRKDQIAHKDYQKLEKLYDSALKAGEPNKALKIGLIMHQKFGVGDYSQGKHFS